MNKEVLAKANNLSAQIEKLESFLRDYDICNRKAIEREGYLLHVILREEDGDYEHGDLPMTTFDRQIFLEDHDYNVLDDIILILRNTLENLKKQLEEL